MKRSAKGIALAESASSATLLLPIIIITVMVSIESTSAYFIHGCLSQAALQAAHDCSAVWGAQNQPNQELTEGQQQAVFNSVEISNVIPKNTSGLNPSFQSAQFDFASTPQTITVTAQFPPSTQVSNKFWPGLNVAFAAFQIPNLFKVRSSCVYPLPSRTNQNP